MGSGCNDRDVVSGNSADIGNGRNRRVRYLDGNWEGDFVFLRCSGQGSVECRVCGQLSWCSNVYARINRDNGYDYYCRACMTALAKRDNDELTTKPNNKRELEYIKTKGLELW